MTRILSFDQSLTASAAIVLNVDEDGTIRLGEQHTFKPKCTGIVRLVSICDWMQDKINEHRPDVLVRELHHMRQFGNAGNLLILSGFLDLLAYRGGFLKYNSYVMVGPSTWKKFCFGKGNLKKDTAYMMHLNKYFQNAPYLSVPSNWELTDDNVGDAICIGITGYIAYRLKNGTKFNLPAQKTKDLEKIQDTMFNYGKA